VFLAVRTIVANLHNICAMGARIGCQQPEGDSKRVPVAYGRPLCLMFCASFCRLIGVLCATRIMFTEGT
jgi:hypothetical protein